ncbi:MerR family transcriptional regulator [Furfurilactobacillus sp. WILCCON 0119]|uniref:MerR family transcriptional regulator n=1 Tax=Furfurilactobacillus entadae TaxID=2922307 RepID=UPI0035E6B2A1
MDRMLGPAETPEWLREILRSDGVLLGISDLARASGVSVTQLRYWTDKGYVDSVSQDEGNRKFTYDTVFKVRAIKAYMDEGFTLAAAAKRMQKHRAVIKILKSVVMDRIEDVRDENGHAVVDFGQFDPDPTKHLLARIEDDGTHFELSDA